MRDSRSKIHMPANLHGFTAFVAYFDILTAPLINRLREIDQPIAAIVLNPPAPLLSARARAELAASLACIEIAIPYPGDPAPLLDALQPANIIHWEYEDAQRTSNLIDHVRTIYIRTTRQSR